MALQAEGIHIGAYLRLEFRRMRFVADQALAVAVRTMNNRFLDCLMAPFTQLGSGSDQGDGRFVFLGHDVVALRATHPDRGMDEPALLFLGMTGQAGLRLDIAWLDVGMLELFLGRNSGGQEETNGGERDAAFP